MDYPPKIKRTVSGPSATFKLSKNYYLIMTGVWVVVLLSILPFLRKSSYMGSGDLHGIIEMVGALCGMVSGFIFIVHYWALASRLFLFIGLAFLINGIEDLSHGFMAFASIHNWVGMPASSLAKFIPGTYVTGRFVMAIMLAIVSLLPIMSGKSRNSHTEAMWVCPFTMIAVALLTTGVFYLPLPKFIFPDQVISRPVDLFSALAFCIALGGFIRLYHRTRDLLVLWVTFSVATNLVGQFIMSFSKVLFDPYFDISHVYKVFGYIIPILGFSLYQISIVNERNHANKELEILNNTLEQQVTERTENLRKSEEYLQNEITKTKLAEKNIIKQKDFLNDIFESITNPLYVINANDYTVEMANSTTYSGELPQGTTCYKLTHKVNTPCEAKDEPCPLNEVKRTKKPAVVEHVHYDDNDKPRFYDVHGYPILDGQGNVKQMIEYSVDITNRKNAEEKLRQSVKQLRIILNGVIRALALTVEQRDPYTAGHQKRVSNLARTIANEMKLPKDKIEGVRIAGIIHDIGKIHIPTEMLCKPGKLTEQEFSFIKTHAQSGYDILKEIEFPWPIAEIVHQHHEKMDGSGYPLGLSDGDILMEARILCVADVVEAMASHRPYRPALGIDVALKEISENRGVLYDPDVVDACLTVIKEKGFEFE